MQYTTALLFSLTGLLGFFVVGVPAVSTMDVVLSTGIWQSLDVISNILAPIIGAITTVVVWIHKRVSKLEEKQLDHEATLYGRENDYLSDGVTKEIYKVSGEMEEFREELRDRFDRLEERLDEVEEEETD